MLQVSVTLQSPELETEAEKGIQMCPGASAAQPPGLPAALPGPSQALTSGLLSPPW